MLDIEKVQELIELYKKHISGELSEADRLLLNKTLDDTPGIRQIFDEASNEETFFKEIFSYYKQAREISQEEIDNAFNRVIEPAKVIPMRESKRAYRKWIGAASILLLASLGFYFWQNSGQPPLAKKEKEQLPTQKEIMPANGSAILVLDDGRKVVVDSIANGVIASNGGKDIVNQGGVLSYQGSSKKVAYNTLVTRRGKIANLLLADGSRVLLNAESTIKFPTEFVGDQRRIEVTGEVYLEVAKNEKKPFIVSVKGMEVQVYGTSFNINAYPEEPNIKTTLIEGKVSVKSGSNRAFIKPGQQAQVNGESINVVKDADVASAIAWKNGMTVLNHTELKIFLNSISRWYDVEVEVIGDIGAHVLLGSMPRRLSLQDVAKALENMTNLKFKIEGRKLVVSK